MDQYNTLSHEWQKKVKTIYEENSYAFRCVELITTNLLQNGLKFTPLHENNEFLMTSLKQTYTTFCKDAIISLMLYGYVAWDIRRCDKYDLFGIDTFLPEVTPGDYVKIQYNMEKKRSSPILKACNSFTNKEIKYFYLKDTPDFLNNKISSPFTRCIRPHIIQSQLSMNLIKSDTRNARTPLLLHNTAEKDGFWALKSFKDDEISDETGRSHFPDKIKDVRQKISTDQLKLAQSFTNYINTMDNIDSKAVGTNLFISNGEPKEAGNGENIPRMNLPPNTQAVSVNHPDTTQHFVEIIKNCATEIAITLGVPAELLFQDRNIKVDSFLINDLLRKTTMEYRKVLQPILTNVFEMSTKLYELKRLVKSIKKPKNPLEPPVSVEIVKNDYDIENYVQLYKEGVMPYDIVVDEVSKKFEVPKKYTQLLKKRHLANDQSESWQKTTSLSSPKKI